MRLRHASRRGATVVEAAVTAPAVFLLLLGLVVGGMGMFRYQQVASLARQAARYASVHGTQYAKDTGNPAATPADIYNSAIAPNAVGLDLSRLSYAVTWNTSNRPYHTDIVNNTVVATGNTVSVTVTYQWVPEAYLGGVTLTSTSVMPMSY
ncbi:MAG TPA: TadE/TadG family type IV pilus assembly protein [Gemmataceae bacterium]|nr:TadE/TadG family type IV pilus assembly protein [Gemmataceae bacterium]